MEIISTLAIGQDAATRERFFLPLLEPTLSSTGHHAAGLILENTGLIKKAITQHQFQRDPSDFVFWTPDQGCTPLDRKLPAEVNAAILTQARRLSQNSTHQENDYYEVGFQRLLRETITLTQEENSSLSTILQKIHQDEIPLKGKSLPLYTEVFFQEEWKLLDDRTKTILRGRAKEFLDLIPTKDLAQPLDWKTILEKKKILIARPNPDFTTQQNQFWATILKLQFQHWQQQEEGTHFFFCEDYTPFFQKEDTLAITQARGHRCHYFLGVADLQALQARLGQTFTLAFVQQIERHVFLRTTDPTTQTWIKHLGGHPPQDVTTLSPNEALVWISGKFSKEKIS